MQLALGQLASSAQQNLLKKILGQQRDIQNSLNQLMKSLEETGSEGIGDLNGVSNDMNEVIKELSQNNYDRSVINRQQQILSRMLDSQKSMAQRGLKENRKS